MNNDSNAPYNETVETYENYTATIELSNLLPLTAYTLWCATSSEEGVPMRMNAMRSQSLALLPIVETSCCKSIEVIIQYGAFANFTSYVGAIIMDVKELPYYDLTINVGIIPSNSSSTSNSSNSSSGVVVDGIFPKSLAISKTSAQAFLNNIQFSLLPTLSGKYTISIELHGSSSHEYALTYPKGDSILVLNDGEEPPYNPVLQSASFASDGTSYAIEPHYLY